jgi:superfamily II DNA/RNA helicase
MPASSTACRAQGRRDRAWLSERASRALPYHAGMDAPTAPKNQARFLREDGIVMVATIAFGMGIDKPDVRFVAHLDLPKSVEGYYQETGRAGRDGEPADAWMAYGLGDVVQQRRMIEGGGRGRSSSASPAPSSTRCWACANPPPAGACACSLLRRGAGRAATATTAWNRRDLGRDRGRAQGAVLRLPHRPALRRRARHRRAARQGQRAHAEVGPRGAQCVRHRPRSRRKDLARCLPPAGGAGPAARGPRTLWRAATHRNQSRRAARRRAVGVGRGMGRPRASEFRQPGNRQQHHMRRRDERRDAQTKPPGAERVHVTRRPESIPKDWPAHSSAHRPRDAPFSEAGIGRPSASRADAMGGAAVSSSTPTLRPLGISIGTRLR